ncbi:hypothetical protein [Streptomyces sp. NPDC092307]|uniref:hypothetical protein n=1 Tax=Streptomyces sp. NPDC092307 TaxID=3366013 RepID=UPI00382C7326
MTVPIASLVHAVAEVIGKAVNERLSPVSIRVLGTVVPRGGTSLKIPARRMGGNGALAASQALSTACLRQAAEMISISFVREGQ